MDAHRSGKAGIDGVELSWDDWGEGRPLVLVHGFTGSSTGWEDVLPGLRESTRVITYDQRGHGQSTGSGKEEDYTADRLIEDLNQLLDALEVKECDLLGHSLGGIVAMRYALRYPSRVLSLILMDTAPEPQPGANQFFELITTFARSAGWNSVLEWALSHPLSPEEELIASRIGEENHRRRMHSNMSSMDLAAFFGICQFALNEPSVADSLPEIGCPTTVLVGGESFLLEAGRKMEGLIPGAQFVSIPGAGHVIQESHPDPWLEAVRDHLTRVRGLTESVLRSEAP